MSLAGVTYGLAFDKSVRHDPYSPVPGVLDWFLNRQPSPDLVETPVVPMGVQGELTWRPDKTDWVWPQTILPPREFPVARGTFAETVVANCANPGDFCRADGGGTAPLATAPEQRSLDEMKKGPLTPPVQQAPPTPQVQTADRPGQFVADLLKQVKERPSGLPTPTAAAACDRDGEICIITAAKYGSLLWSKSDGADPDPLARRLLPNPPPTIHVHDGSLIIDASIANQSRNLTEQLFGTDRNVRIEPGAAATGAIQPHLDGLWFRVDGQLYRRGSPGMDAEALMLEPDIQPFVERAYCYAGQSRFLEAIPAKVSRCFILAPGGVVTAQMESGPGPVIWESVNYQEIPGVRSVFFTNWDIGWAAAPRPGGGHPRLFKTTNGGLYWLEYDYAEAPAPWVLFLAFPALIVTGGILAIRLARHRRRARAPQTGVEGVAVADEPIGWDEPDVLGLKPIALALSRFMRNANTKPPLVVAVSGPWGSGKSSLMNLIYEDLRQRGIRPVRFNAWHHQKESHLLAALLANIRAQAVPSFWTLSGLSYRTRLLQHRAGDLFNAAVLLGLLGGITGLLLAVFGPDVSAKIPELNPLKAGGALAAVASAGAIAWGWLGRAGVDPAKLLSSLRPNASRADIEAQLSFRFQFAKEFGSAAKALRVGGDSGLVIFIDDLDRCSPESLGEILEAINFLATTGLCFIFLGMAEKRVEEILAKRLNTTQDAEAYLRKLINIVVPVPPSTAETTAAMAAGRPPVEEEANARKVRPWLTALRKILRAAPDYVVPITLALSLAMIAVIALPSVEPKAPAVDPANTPSAAATASSQASAPSPAPAISPPPTIDLRITEEVSAPEAPKGLAPAWLMQTARVLPIGLALLFTLIFALRRLVVAPHDEVKDSEDYERAVAIWHPVAFSLDPTPRGVKRHQNQLRLAAMQLRPVQDPPDALARWLGDSDMPAPASSLSDAQLVALGTLDLLGPDAIDAAVQGRLSTWKPSKDRQDIEPTLAGQALEVFKAQFGWPPTPEEIEQYKRVSRSAQL